MSFFSTKFHVCKVLSVSTVLSLFTYMYLYVSRHVVMYFLFFFYFKFQRALEREREREREREKERERERERERENIYIYIFKQICDIIALLLFFLCVFFFVFSSRTDRFFNLSCHLFSYPLSLKQTSSFTKIIFFFFWIFSKNKEREKIICSFFKSLQVKTNFGLRL